ncbi:nodulin homeobox-like [Salvia splendens]|uniref:nodulin homeobox-like n=1 Tax=Salvia splendens TaxID=180675 RepID=UPI001C25B191|nr:nodulin homeobox-like [Salvia splendens]
MFHLTSRVPKIEQILLDDVKISEQLIDLVFYLLVLLGPYRHVDIFIEAEFAAVCVDVKFLQTNDSFGSAFPTTEETLNHLCQSVILLFNFYSPCVSKSCSRNAL